MAVRDGGEGEWELLISGHKVSVEHDEYALETCCATLHLPTLDSNASYTLTFVKRAVDLMFSVLTTIKLKRKDCMLSMIVMSLGEMPRHGIRRSGSVSL